MGRIFQSTTDADGQPLPFSWTYEVDEIFIAPDWQGVQFFKSAAAYSTTLTIPRDGLKWRDLSDALGVVDYVQALYIGDPAHEQPLVLPVFLSVESVAEKMTIRVTAYTAMWQFQKMSSERVYDYGGNNLWRWRHTTTTDGDGNVTNVDDLLYSPVGRDMNDCPYELHLMSSGVKALFLDLQKAGISDMIMPDYGNQEDAPTLPHYLLCNARTDLGESFDAECCTLLPDITPYDLFCRVLNAQGYSVRIDWVMADFGQLQGFPIRYSALIGVQAWQPWSIADAPALPDIYANEDGREAYDSKMLMKGAKVTVGKPATSANYLVVKCGDEVIFSGGRYAPLQTDEATLIDLGLHLGNMLDGDPTSSRTLADGIVVSPAPDPWHAKRLAARVGFMLDARKCTFTADYMAAPLTWWKWSTQNIADPSFTFNKPMQLAEGGLMTIEKASFSRGKWTGEGLLRHRLHHHLLSPRPALAGNSAVVYFDADGNILGTRQEKTQEFIGVPADSSTYFDSAGTGETWGTPEILPERYGLLSLQMAGVSWTATNAYTSSFSAAYDKSWQRNYHIIFGSPLYVCRAGTRIVDTGAFIAITNMHETIDLGSAGSVAAIIIAYPNAQSQYGQPFEPILLEGEEGGEYTGNWETYDYQVAQDRVGANYPENYIFLTAGLSGKWTATFESGQNPPSGMQIKIYLVYNIIF